MPGRLAVNISSPGHQLKPAPLTSGQKPTVSLSLGKDVNHSRVCGDMKMSGSITYINYFLRMLLGKHKQGQDLDLMIFLGSFQLSISSDSECDFLNVF